MAYITQLHLEEPGLTPTSEIPTRQFWDIVDENGERLIIAGIEFYPSEAAAQQQLANHEVA